MTVKRYTPTQCCEHEGTYVTYSDYQKLVANGDKALNEILRLKDKIESQALYISSLEVERKAFEKSSDMIQKLVAENAAMQKATNGVLIHCPINDPDIDKACAAMICNDALQSTPATDAAIAEIKAQGVDEFAEEWGLEYYPVGAEANKFAANLRVGRKG